MLYTTWHMEWTEKHRKSIQAEIEILDHVSHARRVCLSLIVDSFNVLSSLSLPLAARPLQLPVVTNPPIAATYMYHTKLTNIQTSCIHALN